MDVGASVRSNRRSNSFAREESDRAVAFQQVSVLDSSGRVISDDHLTQRAGLGEVAGAVYKWVYSGSWMTAFFTSNQGLGDCKSHS